MKRIALLGVVLAAIFAYGGENNFLGSLTGVSGASASNTNSFWIPFHSRITMYCDYGTRLLTDSAAVSLGGTNRGVPVAAATLFPTSVGAPTWTTDAGLPSASIAVVSNVADGGFVCEVWRRSGTE